MTVRSSLAAINGADLSIETRLQLLIKSLDCVLKLLVVDIAFFVDELLGLITLHLQRTDLAFSFTCLSLLLEQPILLELLVGHQLVMLTVEVAQLILDGRLLVFIVRGIQLVAESLALSLYL